MKCYQTLGLAAFVALSCTKGNKTIAYHTNPLPRRDVETEERAAQQNIE
jgi:hypothetical protein